MSKNENNETNFGYKNVDKTEKPEMVKGVFDSVAENYDLMNDLMSLGIHRDESPKTLGLSLIHI